MNALATLLGRLMLAAVFIWAGWGKLDGFSSAFVYLKQGDIFAIWGKIPGLAATAQMIASKGLPMPNLLAAAAIVVELIGGFMIAIGWKTRLAAFAILAFIIVVSLFFHNFWLMSGQEAHLNTIMFLKNMGLAGGMLYLMAHGPGSISVDRA